MLTLISNAIALVQLAALAWIIYELRRSRYVHANGTAALRRTVERNGVANGHNGLNGHGRNGAPVVPPIPVPVLPTAARM
jgi:hypothetical protein